MRLTPWEDESTAQQAMPSYDTHGLAIKLVQPSNNMNSASLVNVLRLQSITNVVLEENTIYIYWVLGHTLYFHLILGRKKTSKGWHMEGCKERVKVKDKEEWSRELLMRD